MSKEPEGTKAYKKKVKDVTDNFMQNAAGVQEMINTIEAEVFQMLRKKEKLREKLIALRESKRLAPAMAERGAVLLDDVADFCNNYNLRQPAHTRVVDLPNKSERAVLGDGPKLCRHLVIELSPAEVIAAASPASAGSAASASGGGDKNFDNAAPDNASAGSGPAGSGDGTSTNQTRNSGVPALVDEPSVACSFGVVFSPLTALPTAESLAAASPPTSPASAAPAASSVAGAAAAAAASASVPPPPPDQLRPDDVPVLGLKFRLMLPPGASAEGLRAKLQEKVDSHVNEIRASIDSAQKALADAVDAEEAAGDAEKKKEGGDAAAALPSLHDVGDLLWKSLRLVVGVKRGPVVYQATQHIVTLYVYRVLSDAQRKRQAELERAVESRFNDAVKSAHAEAEIKEVKDAVATRGNSRTYRQLCAVARLCADCEVSVNTELQITARRNPAYVPPPPPPASDADDATTGVGALAEKAAEGVSGVATALAKNFDAKKAEGLVSRVLESAPRVEAALRDALRTLTEARDKAPTGADARNMARAHAEALYTQSLLPAIQRTIDPDDLVVALINQLAADDKECPLRPRAIGPPTEKVAKIVAASSSASAESAEAKNKKDEPQPPYLICLNGHNAELCNLPKQLVRQTANMIYDYFLDTTESLSGRAYIGMCRRRTLAGVALYDALHFNIVPLQRGGKSELNKSACAFYHFEKLLRTAVVGAAERAVQSALEARERMSKAIDGSAAAAGVDDAKKESLFSSTVSTLKLAMRIGKRLFGKFQEERAKREAEEAQRRSGGGSSDNVDDDGPATNPFAFVGGQVCCCDTTRPLEVEIYMPDSKAVCTFRTVLRPAVPDFVSPRIRPKRADAKSPQVQAAAMRASACRGQCTTLIPDFGLVVGEAFSSLWMRQLGELVADNKVLERLEEAAGAAAAAASE